MESAAARISSVGFRIHSFLSSAASIVGAQYVISDPAELQRYQNSTLPVEGACSAAVQPNATEEVQELVRLAGSEGIKLYPISRGKNWGYGSALPVDPCSVIIDLSRMNRVLSVNEELGYAEIEPGVSQLDLYQYLRDTSSALTIDPSGAGPDTSIVGNTLERGYGIGVFADHFQACCGMEVVLANGTRIETGFWRFPHCTAKGAYKWGVGPYLDGIFTQSNFGIVTRMGIWLQPEAEKTLACYFRCNDQSLAVVLGEIRTLLTHKVISGGVNLSNRSRVLSMREQYPWTSSPSGGSLSNDLERSLAAKYGAADWNGVFALHGLTQQVSANRLIIEERLSKHLESLSFVSREDLDSSEFKENQFIHESFQLLGGFPSGMSLRIPYWRNRGATPPRTNIDPDLDQCGLIWCAPIVPLLAANVAECLTLCESTLHEFELDWNVTMTALHSRALSFTIPILFDQNNESEKTRAWNCYHALVERCSQAGYFPYRATSQSMSIFSHRGSGFTKTVERIKRALDPNDTIASGRYCPPLAPLTTKSPEPTAIIRRYLACLESGDLTTMLELFTPDALVDSPQFGILAPATLFPPLFEKVKSAKITEHSIMRAQNHTSLFSAHFSYRWTLCDGTPGALECTDLFYLSADEQKIQRIEIFAKPAPASP